MCMNLALAPATDFEAGLQSIEEKYEKLIKEFPKIKLFLKYIKEQWLPRVSVVCVFKNRRTNNGVESFHKNALDELGGIHQNMYTFLSKKVYYYSYLKKYDINI